MLKSGVRGFFLSFVVTMIILVSFVALPLSMFVQSAAAPPVDIIDDTPNWTRTGLGAGAAGVLIAEVDDDYPGEEVFWVGDGRVTCMRGDTGANIWTRTFDYIWYWVQPQMADLDLDGIPEIIIARSRWQNNGLTVLHGDDGSTYWEIWGLGGNSMTSSPVIGDIDGDGPRPPTIFVASEDVLEPADRPEEHDDNGLDGTARLYAIEGTTGNILAETFVWRACAGGVSLVDGDHDDIYELYMGDRHMYMGSDGCWGKGVRSFWAENLSVRWNYADWLCSSQAPTLADVNGDGILEVIVSNQRGGLMLLDSRTGHAIRKDTRRDLPMHYQASVGDVDNDGNLELCMADGDHSRYAAYNVTIFDLVNWEVDARISVGNPAVENSYRCHYGPQLADVTGDGQLEIIAASYLGVHIINGTSFEIIDEDVWSGTPWDEETDIGDKTNYAVMQDINGDGDVDIVVASHVGTVRAWFTEAPVPTPRARTEVQFCSELRQGVAVHVPPLGEEPEPIISTPSPGDKAVDVPQTVSELSFTLLDNQGGSMDYTVETFPDIGTDSGTVASGTPVSVTLGSLLFSQVYSWQVNVTDGTHWTNKTFTFRTEYESVANDPPSHSTPIIDDGDGTSGDFLTCYNQSTYDDGVLEPVANVYNWRVDGSSLTTLLLPCDIRSATTASDHSGYNNDATLHGPTWTSEGIVGGCYEYDGYDDYATIPHSASLGGSGTWSEITIELWVYLSQDQQDTRLIAKIPSYEIGFSGQGNNMLFAGVWTDTFDYDEEDDEYSLRGQYADTSSYGLSTNVWHHVAMTYKNMTGLTLYVNGTAVAFTYQEGDIKATTGSGTDADEPVYLGWFDYFAGKIDEVRMYRRALSPEQVYQRYMDTKDGSSSSSTIVPQETTWGEEWYCEVTPNDGITDGEKKSSNTVGPLGNAPPEASNLEIYPLRQRDLRLDDENLVSAYEYFDLDGDPEEDSEIRWYKNNVHEPTFDDETEVPADSTTAGEEWNFTVRPQDDQGDFGDLAASYTVTIFENSLPTHDAPLLVSSAGTNRTDDDLIASNQSTADSDGDAVTNIYHWVRNGDSLTNLLTPFDTEVPLYIDANGTTLDYSGWGNDGTVVGATWIEEGIVGGAFSFDGNDFIRVQESGSSLGGDGGWSEISVEFWVKATGITSTEEAIIMHDADSSTISYRFRFRAYDYRDRFYWYVYNDTDSESVQFSDYENFGEWHHVVGTYESGVGLKLYVDGTERASVAFSGNINATVDDLLDIGGLGSGGTDFSGLLDEVRIYPRALSSAQIFQRFIEMKDGLSSSSTIVAQETAAGDYWECEVIPNDSWGDGTPETSDLLTVLEAGVNSRPRIDFYTPTDTTPEVDEGVSLEFNHTSSDPDGDLLFYSWLLDDVEQATSQNWTYTPGLGEAGTYNVTLVVSDPDLLFDFQQWDVIVSEANEAPVIDTYYPLTDPTINEGESQEFNATYHDPDGDILTVQWYLNGTPTSTLDNYTFIADYDSAGTYNVTVVISDGSYEVSHEWTLIVQDVTLQYELTIEVASAGTTDPEPGVYMYDEGTLVAVDAIPDSGWMLDHWLLDDVNAGSEDPYTVTMNADHNLTAVFVVSTKSLIPLSNWSVDSRYTNAPYVLSSTESSLSLELQATDVNSRVTIRHLNVPKLALSDYDYVDVTVEGSVNAKILLRFFLDDGSAFDVAYWKDPDMLNATVFDLSAYSGRTLRGDVYLGLMSSDGLTSSIEITEIAFVQEGSQRFIPLSGWSVDSRYTNAPYTLSSTESSLFLQLDATGTGDRVTIRHLAVPQLDLSGYAYVDVECSGTDNARILLRFFMDDGSAFDVAYWKDPDTLNAASFDLSAYAGRTLRGDVYIGLMSSDGSTSSVEITEIAFVAEALPPLIPLSGWSVDSRYTNAPYTLSSTESSLSLELQAVDVDSRVTIRHLDVPRLSLSEYDYVDVTVDGTDNARILLRFFLDDGSSFDVAYWNDPDTLNASTFDLSPYSERTLRGDVYIGLMSSDGSTSNVTITEISLVDV